MALFNEIEFNQGDSTPPTSSATVLTGLINPAFRIAGIMGAPGRNSSNSEQTEAFDILNTLIDGWNVERLTIYAEDRLVFPLVNGQQEYTIGPTGNFDTTRPLRIDRGSIIIQPGSEQPMEVPLQILTYAQWQAIATKNVQSSIPRLLYYQPKYPLGHLFYWPLPEAQPVQTVLYVWIQLPGYATINDPVALPPGYLKALRYNLASDIADMYPNRTKMSAKSYQMAAESKAWVKRQNYIPLDIQVDPALIDNTNVGWNIYTGEYNR